jgi:crotonobetainyl-CoA:carnitine CoA-transferase CaiB-like acyl-CoA transferase
MASALDGLVVLDLSCGRAAAMATMFLGDHGARVIRIVAPGAPHLREGGFIVWDRGKTCVRLDLEAALADLDAQRRPDTQRAGQDLLRLVAGADILVEDFAPDSPMQRLVDWSRLERHNPRLVACSITAYGKRGPWRDEPPIDDLVLARTGLLSGMPGFRPAPVHVVFPLPSVGAALLGATGIAAALLARETTGRGRTVETSLMAGALLYQTKLTGERLDRQVFQTHPSGSAPFYSVYPCSDGQWVQLGCVHIGFIRAAANVMGIADLIEEPRFKIGVGGAAPQDDAELRAALTRVLQSRPYAEWAAAFEAADVPFAPARLSSEGLGDPQVAHNGMAMTLDDPAAGPATQMGIPVRLSGTPGRIAGPRPASVVEAGEVAVPSVPHPAKKPAEASDPPPLAGVRILEITNLIAGPTAGRILADLGADVIKLEPPGGDMSRPIARTYFYCVNFNKRSVCVDTQTEAGKRIVQRIAASADALLANLRPHATERMGIGPTVNSRLIETHLTGYGWTGPYAARPGIDPLAQALMGMSRAQGGAENPPVFAAQLAPTDYTNGAMGAFGTILALYARTRTGIVQRVDSDLLSSAILLSSEWFTRYAGRPEQPLADKDQLGLNPFHRLYRLSDGWIYVVAEGEAARAGLCRIAGVPRAGSEAPPSAGQHRNATPLARGLAERLATLQRGSILAALEAAGVPACEVLAADSEAFLDHPHPAASGLIATCQHPTGGRMRVAWQLMQFGRTRPRDVLPTPLLGEHTAQVLGEIGYSPQEIEALGADGAIRTTQAPA